MMDTMLSALRAGLPGLGVTIPEGADETLCKFGCELVEQNKVMNLPAIAAPAAVAKLHLLDCLTVLKCENLAGRKLNDVGCGAGYPGVPLKIGCPELDLTLLDSLGKRMHWLEATLPTLGVEATYITARAEEAVADRREKYDFATSRAVARLNILLELTAPYVKVGGAVLAMKGAAGKEELAECKNAIKQLGLKLEKVHEFPMDGTNHMVIVLRKIAPTPAKYPTRYSKIKAAPL